MTEQRVSNRKLSHWFPLCVLALGIAVISGCSGEESGGISSNEVARLAEDTSDYQKAILADNKVTHAEYEKAMNAERDCIISEGYTVTELAPLQGELSYVIEVQNDNTDVVEDMTQKLDQVQERCHSEYSSEVGWVWNQQKVLSESEREEMRPKVHQCFREAGLVVGDSISDEELATILAQVDSTDQEKSDAVLACADQYYEYFIWAP